MVGSSYTTSVCQISPVSCSHRVKILGYSLTMELNITETIRCGAFSLGGCEWDILYDPNYYYSYNGGKYYVSFHLKLLTEAQPFWAFLSFSLVDESGVASLTDKKSGTFNYTKKGDKNGFHQFMQRKALDNSVYVKNGNITIQCDLHIIKPSLKIETSISVLPSDLSQHLDNLFQSKEGADVTFKVQGEKFSAHRSILAARSSVFRAMFFGPMKERKNKCIEIKDMEPEVFEALLYFMYTDKSDLLVPGSEHSDQDADEDNLVQHLIVASDRYDLARLRSICEDKLARRICPENVVDIRILAGQNNCQNLEKICLDYISTENLDSDNKKRKSA